MQTLSHVFYIASDVKRVGNDLRIDFQNSTTQETVSLSRDNVDFLRKNWATYVSSSGNELERLKEKLTYPMQTVIQGLIMNRALQEDNDLRGEAEYIVVQNAQFDEAYRMFQNPPKSGLS